MCGELHRRAAASPSEVCIHWRIVWALDHPFGLAIYVVWYRHFCVVSACVLDLDVRARTVTKIK